jgi:hypothetical protein
MLLKVEKVSFIKVTILVKNYGGVVGVIGTGLSYGFLVYSGLFLYFDDALFDILLFE